MRGDRVQGLHALSHAYKGGDTRATVHTHSGGHSPQHTVYDRRMPPATHYSDAEKGPSASGGWHSSSSARDKKSGDARTQGTMSARFEAVHHKSSSLARLGEKHQQVYANAADQNAHHTAESLPYLLPPIGFVTLLLVFGGSYSVKRWQRIPNGVRTLLSSRVYMYLVCVCHLYVSAWQEVGVFGPAYAARGGPAGAKI